MFKDWVPDVRCFGHGCMQGERVIENSVMGREEVVKALHKMKCGRVTGVDGIAVEFLSEWMDHERVPED